MSLTILRGAGQALREERPVTEAELVVGRDAASCGWTLSDPHRTLSRRHCCLRSTAGRWELLDLSTNGTFVNGSPDPLGRDRSHVLRDGDRLQLGDYEIQVRLVAPAVPLLMPQAPAPRETPVWPPPEPAHGPLSSAGWDPGPGPAAPGGSPGFGGARVPGLDDGDGPAHDPGPGPGHDTPPDHGPVTGEVYQPPIPVPATGGAPGPDDLPPDWWNQTPTGPTNTPGELPDKWWEKEPAARPPASSPVDGTARGQEAAADRPPAPSPPEPAPLPSPEVPPSRAAVEAMLRALDVLPQAIPRLQDDPDRALRHAAEMLRVAVAGLRALLAARALVKREFRIEQTILRPKQNNALKFAASDEQALVALLDPQRDGPSEVRQVVDDLTSHEVAVLEATQVAARAMLERLSPALLEADDVGGGVLPGSTEKRLWLAYKRRHAKLLEQLEDDFDSAFGAAFARAYEEASRKPR